jgi:hypothetical protein
MDTTTSTSFLSNFYTAFIIISLLCFFGFGVWLGLKMNTTTTQKSPPPPKEKKNIPSPHSSDTQYNVEPSKPPPPPTPPAPTPVNFNPKLKLISGVYNPVAKEIHVKYNVDADTPIPPTRTYSINFFVLVNNKKLGNPPISEDEPLHQSDIGLDQEVLLEITGIGNTLKGSKLSVEAQIHYYDSSGKYSVVGTPQSIVVI